MSVDRRRRQKTGSGKGSISKLRKNKMEKKEGGKGIEDQGSRWKRQKKREEEGRRRPGNFSGDDLISGDDKWSDDNQRQTVGNEHMASQINTVEKNYSRLFSNSLHHCKDEETY
ncbi:unnamed protein product [Cuscuta epithymum]|uniref:Uncharacterized protein n=1 Tax=Cuscuta epithymum TaxID=186058 RepID=A0AAV0G3V4_9ASTE|nr:unnamed protein product [Cuscuta epithymum]